MLQNNHNCDVISIENELDHFHSIQMDSIKLNDQICTENDSTEHNNHNKTFSSSASTNNIPVSKIL